MENRKKLVLPKTLLGNLSNPINLEEEEEQQDQQKQQEKNLNAQNFEQIIEKLNVNNEDYHKKRTYNNQLFFEREYKRKTRLETPLSKEEEEQEYRNRTNKAIDDMMRQLRKIDTRVGIVFNKVEIIEKKIEQSDKYNS